MKAESSLAKLSSLFNPRAVHPARPGRPGATFRGVGLKHGAFRRYMKMVLSKRFYNVVHGMWTTMVLKQLSWLYDELCTGEFTQ